MDARRCGVVASTEAGRPVPMKILTLRHESPRGSFAYSEWRPPELAGLVELVWYSEGTTTEARDRHFPDTSLELLVNLGDPFLLIEPKGTEVFAASWLAGVQSGPVVTEQPRSHRVLGVRLRPAGAYAFLATPLNEVSGLVVDLHDVIGHAAAELVDRCREASSIGARLRIAADWVARRVARAHGIDPAIAWAAAQIEGTGGGVPIATLREQTGFSKTRLSEAFRAQMGVTPKRYARIVRFRRTLALLQRGAAPLIDVALTAGYYDQPHMNVEFRALSGLTPREFLAGQYVLEGATETPP